MQYNKDEKKCIRIIAKWFRENRGFVNRSEAIKELGVDDDRYDVLIKVMEHNGVVENVRSVMGEDGYAIAFQPSVYAEELAREFDEEDKRQNEGRAYGKGKYGEDIYGGKTERKDDENKTSEEFQRIRLEPEQKELLSVIVEAVRSVPRKKRRKFIVIQSMGGTFIHHDGLDENTEAYLGDIEILDNEGLLAITYGSQGSTLFDVTPLGLAYYDNMKRGLSKKQRGSKYDEGQSGGEEREDREDTEQLIRDVLDGQKRLLAKFKEFLVTEKGVPENELVDERVWVDEIRPLDLDVLFIRERDKTLAIIEYYFFDSSLKQPEREQKLLKKYKEKVKLEGCPAYIACLAPDKGERLVDIYQVTEGEELIYISREEFPTYEDLRKKMNEKGLVTEGLQGAVQEQVDVEGIATVEVLDKIKIMGMSVAEHGWGDRIADKDKLGFRPYVEVVARFLTHEETELPLNLSVEGEWGSGKSSFLLQLKNEIGRIYKDKGEENAFIVEFDPWRHDKDEALWAAFALEFIRQASVRL